MEAKERVQNPRVHQVRVIKARQGRGQLTGGNYTHIQDCGGKVKQREACQGKNKARGVWSLKCILNDIWEPF